MKWLLVTTSPAPDAAGEWNVGDRFALDGTKEMIRAVDPGAEFDELNVDDREDVMRERPFDRLVLAGRPLFWAGCTKHHLWTHVLEGWPGRDPDKVLALGVGDCYRLPRNEAHLAWAMEKAARKCFRVLTRWDVDHPLADVSVCPGAFAALRMATRTPAMKITRKLANIMPGGGHYPDWMPEEAAAWKEKEQDVARVLIAGGFEFVAHTRREAEDAARLGWALEAIHQPATVLGYLALYAEAETYIGNRMHGAVAASASASRIRGIGFDSRNDMLTRLKIISVRPSELTVGMVERWVSTPPLAGAVAERCQAIGQEWPRVIQVLQQFKEQVRKRRCFVQLGRAGDLINIFPLLKREFDATGRRPLLYTRTQFARLVEGTRYIEPVLSDGPFEELLPALQEAQKVADKAQAALICTQIYGKDLVGSEECSSFVRESWDRVPDAPSWGTLRPVFDRRDKDRERAVVEQLRKQPDRPYIVAALRGTSSPLECAPELARELRIYGEKFGIEVIDVSAFITDRFFDLLGLLEGAQTIIATDSGVLHLAAATETPVIALITREPTTWHGTAWRPQHQIRLFYDEIGSRVMVSMVAIAAFVEFTPRSHVPSILHVFSDYEANDAETNRRQAFARQTWLAEKRNAPGLWATKPIHDEKLKRSSRDIGDSRAMPFVRDLIDAAMDATSLDRQIIAWTNADVCFTPGLTGWIMDRVPRVGACFTHRWDFARLDKPLRNEAAVRRGEWYPGSDAFFFTREWWLAHRDEYPDMIAGREHCNEVLRQLIKGSGGLEIPAAIYHEKHESFWEAPEERQRNAGNRHNRALARKWFLRRGYGPNDPSWWAIPRS